MQYGITMESPFGALSVVEQGEQITRIYFGELEARVQRQETAVLAEARRQLEEYFAGLRGGFSLPLNPAGTDFQRRVWAALETIPFGETRSYGEIAAQIGQPGAARAVGGANHVNPIAIMIPCHRVIGADGSLTGYAGGLDIKAGLLKLEGVIA